MKRAFRVIAFMYRESKLKILEQVLMEHKNWGAVVCDVAITTNTNDKNEIKKIEEIGRKAEINNFQVVSYPELPNNWLLPWAHKPLLLAAYNLKKYDYYLYSEDDIFITKANIEYFDQHRILLKKFHLYPMFTRVEWSKRNAQWVFTDIQHRIRLDQTSCIKFSNVDYEYDYYCSTNPYQAMLMYDNELMNEHINSQTFDIRLYGGVENISSNPNHPGGGVAEKAALGLTFQGLTSTLTSRCLIPLHHYYHCIDTRAFVHHLGDAYADKHDIFGRITVFDLVELSV